MNKDEYIKEVHCIHMDKVFQQNMKEELNQYALQKSKKPFVLQHFTIGLVSLCLILIFFYTGFLVLNDNKQGNIPDIISQPSLQINNTIPHIKEPTLFHVNGLSCNGFGSSSILVKEKDELLKESLYDIHQPHSTMPVYYNLHSLNSKDVERYSMSNIEKRNLLVSYANKLQIKDYEIKENKDSHQFILKSQYYTLTLEDSTALFISFSKEYQKHISIDMKANNQKEADKLTFELYERYRKLFDIDDPLITTSYEYNIYGQKIWNYSISEKAEDQAKTLLSSLTNQVEFYSTEDFQLEGMRIYKKNKNIKVRDYPMISLEEAKQKLYSGEYISSVDSLPSLNIGYVDITYNNNMYNEYFLPYYQFYIYSGDYNSEGVDLKEYTVCWVPALKNQELHKESSTFYQ